MMSSSFVIPKRASTPPLRINSARRSPRIPLSTGSAPNSGKSRTNQREDTKNCLSARRSTDAFDDPRKLSLKKKSSLSVSTYDLNGRKIVESQAIEQLDPKYQGLTEAMTDQHIDDEINEIYLTTIKESRETLKSASNGSIGIFENSDTTSNVHHKTNESKVSTVIRSKVNASASSGCYFDKLKKTLPPNAMNEINRNIDTKTAIPKRNVDSPRSMVRSKSPRGRKGTYTVLKTAQSCNDFMNSHQTEPTVCDPINSSASNTNTIDKEPNNRNRESLMALREQLSAITYNERRPPEEISIFQAFFNFVCPAAICVAVVCCIVLIYLNEENPEGMIPVMTPKKPPRPATALMVNTNNFLHNLLRIWRNFLKNVFGFKYD